MVTIFHRNETKGSILMINSETLDYWCFDLDMNPVIPAIIPFRVEYDALGKKICIEDRWMDGSDNHYDDAIIRIRETWEYTEAYVFAQGDDECYVYIEDVEFEKLAKCKIEGAVALVVEPQHNPIMEFWDKDLNPGESVEAEGSVAEISKLHVTVEGWRGAYGYLYITVKQNDNVLLEGRVIEVKALTEILMLPVLHPERSVHVKIENRHGSATAGFYHLSVLAVTKRYVPLKKWQRGI